MSGGPDCRLLAAGRGLAAKEVKPGPRVTLRHGEEMVARTEKVSKALFVRLTPVARRAGESKRGAAS